MPRLGVLLISGTLTGAAEVSPPVPVTSAVESRILRAWVSLGARGEENSRPRLDGSFEFPEDSSNLGLYDLSSAPSSPGNLIGGAHRVLTGRVPLT